MTEATFRDMTHEEFSKSIYRIHAYKFMSSLDECTEEDRLAGVNDFTEDDGYFGRWLVIKFKGKYSMLKYSRCSDSGCESTNYWYDKIIYGKGYDCWSADYRWNSDKPLVAIIAGRYTIIHPHSARPLLQTPIDSISTKWQYNKTLGYYLLGSKEGRSCKVLTTGQLIFDEEELKDKLLKWKEVSDTDTIEKEWIDAGGKCVLSHGLWNGGEGHGQIVTPAEAKIMNRNFNFGNGYYVKMWSFSKELGDIVLEFNTRSEADML